MSLMTGMMKTATLVNGLLSKNPGNLSFDDIDRLQNFVNKGRSMILLENHPHLEGIFSSHAIEDSRKVRDILFCFMEEGGVIGGPSFRKMVDGMVNKGMVTPAIIDVLQNNRFLLPNPLQRLNADGVAV